jgi:hypothetical protein
MAVAEIGAQYSPAGRSESTLQSSKERASV